MADPFNTSTDNVSLHLKNIFAHKESGEPANNRGFLGSSSRRWSADRRRVKRYHLDAIISVGYGVNSRRGVRFRQRATGLAEAAA
jgi:hypothetical protein